jgi:hypothetical protein
MLPRPEAVILKVGKFLSCGIAEIGCAPRTRDQASRFVGHSTQIPVRHANDNSIQTVGIINNNYCFIILFGPKYVLFSGAVIADTLDAEIKTHYPLSHPNIAATR